MQGYERGERQRHNAPASPLLKKFYNHNGETANSPKHCVNASCSLKTRQMGIFLVSDALLHGFLTQGQFFFDLLLDISESFFLHHLLSWFRTTEDG